MPHLALMLLGPFQASWDEQPVAGFRSKKTRALLAYLALERGRPHTRQALAALLWPDCPEATALTYLRGELGNLRRLLGDGVADCIPSAPPLLLVTRTTISLNPAAPSVVDTAVLDALHVTTAAPHELAAAAALYRGALLEGLEIDEGSPFEEWLLVKREHYQRLALGILQQLARLALDGREYAAAAEYAQRQLAIEAWDETAHRQLMMAQALSGKRGAALAQYAVCRTLLAQELGVEPERETTDLYLHIRAGHLSAAVAPAGGASSAPAYMLQELTPFAGRTRELAQLDAQLDLVLAGAGRTVFIRGDAGSGKTALLYAFGRRATQRRTAVTVADGRCSNYHGNGDSFLPFREIVQLLVNAGMLPAAAGRDAAPTPFVQPRKGGRRDSPADAGDLHEQVTALLQEAARRHPLILLLDDLQWADSGTLSLLFHLGRRLGDSRILLVGAYRPEDVAQQEAGKRHPLSAIVHELQRDMGEAAIDLNRGEGRAFVDALVDLEPNQLGAEFRATLHRYTEGHALFTVELLRAMKERGALVRGEGGEWREGGVPDWGRLPPRVEAVIAERIERLPPLLRSLLEAASVQGETFSVEVLARSLIADEGQFVWLLSELAGRQHELVQAELRRTLTPPGLPLLRYRFTHSLYQTYLYARLDAAQRAYLHRRAALALEALYGQAGGEVAALLAWHYEQAGATAQAAHCLRLAGDYAMDISACQEAIGYYLRGLALLESLPASPARAEQELTLQVALATPFIIMGGWGGERAHAAIVRACELCQATGAQAQLVEALFLLATNYVGRGRIADALNVGESLLLLAQESSDCDAQAAAHTVLGEAHLFGGDLSSARLHLARGVALLDGRPLEQLTARTGVHLRVAGLTWLGSTLWAQGLLDQATACNRAALAQAQALGQPRSLGFALLLAGALYDLQVDDLYAAEEKVAAVLQMAGEKNLVLYCHIGSVYQGYLRVRRGQAAAGIAQMQAALAAWRALGESAGMVQHYLLLGRACCAGGEVALGLATVADGLAFAERHGMPYNEAELWRARGDLLLQAGRGEEAAGCFVQARELARGQGARLWELRALLSLCRLRQSEGRQVEVLPDLAAVYREFQEGFALPDLQAAQALLP